MKNKIRNKSSHLEEKQSCSVEAVAHYFPEEFI